MASDKPTISYNLEKNVIDLVYKKITAEFNLTPSILVQYGCDDILNEFQKKHPQWLKEFNYMLKKATKGCHKKADADTYAEIQAIQLAGFLHSKWLVIQSQKSRKIKPDLGKP